MSRPEKPIDWKLVDELLMANCHGTEIAPHFDMHINTFYDRVMQKFGIGFTQYSTEKKGQGDSCLRHKQYEKALNGDNGKGDATMLIFLGKTRLNQREHEEKKEAYPLDEFNDAKNNWIKAQSIIADQDKKIKDLEARLNLDAAYAQMKMAVDASQS